MRSRPSIPSNFRLPFQLRNRSNVVSKGTANVRALPAHPKPASSGQRPAQPPKQFKWARWCGILAVLIYFIRGTVLSWYLHVPDSAWILLTCAVLFVGAGMAVAGGGRLRWSWAIVLFAFAVSISKAEQPISSGLHWFGLALVILAVGPMIMNPVAIELRSAAWKLTIRGLTSLTAIFVVWYLARLPSLGAGDFSSFMSHCMLLAPIAGMGVVIALVRALHGRSWRWGLLAVLGLLPLLAAGSRVATLATGVAGCFLMIRRKPILGVSVALLFLAVVYGFVAHSDSGEASDEVTGALSRKGIENTRAELWQDRILEFESSPVFGIGVAMGTGNSTDQSQNGSIRVEPGSCYLAILAMTGAVGTVAFFSALGLLLFGYVKSQRQAGLDRDILNVVGIYLAVHGVAEGWILTFGSPLCFLFWLWLGNVGDAALQPVRARTKRGLRAIMRPPSADFLNAETLKR